MRVRDTHIAAMAEEAEAIELKAVAMEPNDCPLVRCTTAPAELPALACAVRISPGGPRVLLCVRSHTAPPCVRSLPPLGARRAGLGADSEDDVQDQQAGRKCRVGPQVHGRYGIQAQAHWLPAFRVAAAPRAHRGGLSQPDALMRAPDLPCARKTCRECWRLEHALIASLGAGVRNAFADALAVERGEQH